MSGFFVSHDQTTSTDHPSASRSVIFRASRAMLSSNFRAQNSARVFGVLAARHPEWRCQKHPCTKITFRRPGNAMSGVPGKSRRCRRNRYPRRWSRRRTAISGSVFFCLTRRMSAFRASGVCASPLGGFGRGIVFDGLDHLVELIHQRTLLKIVLV